MGQWLTILAIYSKGCGLNYRPKQYSIRNYIHLEIHDMYVYQYPIPEVKTMLSLGLDDREGKCLRYYYYYFGEVLFYFG